MYLFQNIISISMISVQKIPNCLNTRTKHQNKSPITIYPREVIFEGISSNGYYQIDLYIRNQSREIQKLRIINPKTKHFKVKCQQGYLKSLAQGLTMKISVFFKCQKLAGQKQFSDIFYICGDNFKETVELKAFPNRDIVEIPPVFNVGRLLTIYDNFRSIPIKNHGKIPVDLNCQSQSTNVSLKYNLYLEPSSTINLDIKLRSKKPGPLIQKIKFSNGISCQLRGVFVQEATEYFSEDGEKLMMIDIGPIFVGERVEYSFVMLNNSEKKVESIFKTFSKNMETSDIKVDLERGNFIIKAAPNDYAKQLKNCFSSVQTEKVSVQPFGQFQNKVIIYEAPSYEDKKKFQNYAIGQFQSEIEEHPIIQTLIIHSNQAKNIIKVPIKFISVFPRLKISSSVLQFGEVKERTDAFQQLTIANEGDRDIPLIIEHPQIIKVEGQMILRGHRSQKYKVHLRCVRAGKINDKIVFKLFEGLVLEVKVFASCRSTSIRSKMYNSSSSRDLKGKNQFYITLSSNNTNFQSQSVNLNSTICNRTDYLGEIRTARINRLLKQNIQTEKQPRLKSPHPSFDQSKMLMISTQRKNAFIKKFSKESLNRLPLKDISKYNRTLNVNEIANIYVSDSQINFGNIFVDSLASRTIKVTNKNQEPILFQFDIGINQTLKETNCQTNIIEPFSSRQFIIKFKPNTLGTMFLPLEYIINRNHTFQLTLTAYVTLVNLDLSTKIIEIGFTTDEALFQKFQEIQLNNRGNQIIKCLARFQQAKHFYVSSEMIELSPCTKKKLKVNYRPIEGEESGLERIDMDKLMIKVVGGAENIIKCIGTVNDAKITVKESQIYCIGQIVSLPFTGKINVKNQAKTQGLYKIQVPNELAQIISFDKEINVLGAEEKREIVYTLLCPTAKKISSYFTFCVRGGRTTRIPVQCSFVMPQIQANKEIIDFGNIPIMGNNYLQLISLTNLHKNQLKFELSKHADCQDYLIEIRQVIKAKNDEEFSQTEFKLRKKTTREQSKQKKGQFGQKILKLLPNVQTFLEVRFIPRKIQQFQVSFPLKLYGTLNAQVEPVPVKLQCSSIQPVVYLHPQKLAFQTRIIGQSRASYTKSFEIRNPHDYNIDWRIQIIQTEKSGGFFMSETRGHLKSHQSVNIQVTFKPEQEGYYFEKYDVILQYKKTSHISLQFQGHAVFPCLKFNCNEVLMPVVPLKVQSRSYVTLQNHGYDAITISKWKTSSHFPNVDIFLNFVQGKLLSLAKKSLKVEIICSSQHPISFTTMLEFYDQFGTKYQVPLSCTFENCLMTTFNFLEDQSSKEIVYDKKQNIVKMLPFIPTAYENSQNVSAKDVVSCQFIKNWLNYQLNFTIKKFPNCFIESEGDMFFKLVNKISGSDLLRKFQRSSTDLALNLYSYYSDCIRILKIEGAFLNQIRPQFLLSFRDYKTYINSKNLILQSQNDFQLISIKAWTALFYQLCKLFVMNTISEKFISKFVQNNTTPLNSTVYSIQQLLLFRFLNSFLNDEPIFNFNNQIKIFQILQKSLQKTFNLNLSSSLQALKVSVTIMAPTLFIVLASQFLHEQLKQYSLSLFLSETDLYTIGSKQFMLFLVSYINMLYHYTTPTLICFDASIGDRVTKIIDIQNPTNRKAKYKVKLQGSEQFQLEQNQVSLPCKSKSQIRVTYQCKQKKDQQGRLYLIPIKQENGNACVQPLSFKLTTSIISKITLKKIQITANLYEVTTVALQAELPIDIAQLVEFAVTITNEDEQSPSFFCFQQMSRTLKSNHDKLDLKLIPFTLGNKYCKVCYRSAVYGQFNFQITAKIQPSTILKQIRLKQLKVNKQQTISIYIPKQNQQLSAAIRFMNDHHIKLSETNTATRRTIPANKYTLSIVQSSYISICQECTEIPRVQLEGKEVMQINLKCLFGKPFADYSCTLMLKNDVLKDIRYYKLVTSVAMKPRIIPIVMRCKARESVTTKIAIKIAPCDLTFQNTVDQFSVANFSPHFKQNVDLVGTFCPDWVMKKQVSLLAENHQTLQQQIYQISLIADQPSYFDSVKLYGSAVFSKAAKIPLILHLSGQFQVVCNSNRIKVQGNGKFIFNRKYLNVTVLPDCSDQVSSIKFYKEGTNHYYWISVSVVNPKIQLFKSISIEQVPNGSKTMIIDDLELSNDHQIYCRQRQFFKHSVLKKNGKNVLCLEFRPNKQMQVTQKLYLFNNQKQYQIDIICKSPKIPQIVLPEITSTNMAIKTTSINLINYSNNKGNYKATIRPEGIFNLEHSDFELRGKQKKQIKIIFTPNNLLTRYDGLLKFQSQTLPTYEYNFSAISQFGQAEKTIQCQCYTDKDTLKDIYFTNYFAKTEDFTIQTHFKNTPFELVQPQGRKFSLQAGSSKRMIVKAKSQSKRQNLNGRLTIRIGQKTWTYNIIPLQIKNFMNKKIVWNCNARQICYDIIDLPDNIKVKSIESAPEISPYLTFSSMEETNQLKLKYNPLKPLSKQQYQILLITDSSKYLINCTISVALAEFDDIIFIKTKEINEVGCVSFKLTNIKKVSTPFKIFFLKGSTDFSVETQKNILQPYGRIGTNIFVKFTSHVFNKKVQDQLWVETSEMLWRFKVKGMLSKVLSIK